MSGSTIGGGVGLLLGAALAPATFGASAWAGAAFGFAGGSLIGGMVSPPTLPGQTAEGPRLQDLKVQSASYGKPIPIILGRMRTAGNILWIKTGGLIEERIEQTTRSGGGKTGGGASSTQIFYNYYATCAIAICTGPIKAVLKVWADSKLIYNAEATDEGTKNANAQFLLWAHGYLGNETQIPDSVIEADLGAGNVPAYRGIAYIVFERFPLKDYGNRIPNFTFEVIALVPTGSGSGDASQYIEVPVNTPLAPEYKLVLNFNGTNGANQVGDFKDSSRYQKTASLTSSYGGMSLSTSRKVFGSASGYFPDNAVLQFEHPSDFEISRSIPWQISFRLRAETVLGPSLDIIDAKTAYDGWFISYYDDGTTTKLSFETGYKPWGTAMYTASFTSVPLGTWMAFRVSCDGNGTVRIYKDGLLLYSGTLTTFGSAAGLVQIKNTKTYNYAPPPSPTADIYIDEFIFQKGGAVTIASSYAVEATELSPVQVTRSQVAGGMLEYPDYSGYGREAVSITGSPSGSSAQKKFGAASGLFPPGSAINYHNADWQHLQNTGSWGISFNIRFKDTIASAVIMSTGGVNGDGWQLEYEHSYTNIYVYGNCRAIKFTHSSGTILRFPFVFPYNTPRDPVANTWYTIGLSFSGGDLRCYIDGVYLPGTKITLGTITNNVNSNFTIGQASGGTTSYYLDELIIRDSTGIHLLESNYPVPTEEFIADSNTRLLLHFNQVFSAVGAGDWSSGKAFVDTKVSNIIHYLCEKAGLTDVNTDYIALNDNAVVPGFVMNNIAPVRQSLEMLAAAFLLDVVESTTTLYFVSRNSLISGGPAAIIPEDDLSARHVTSSTPEPLDITTQQEVEIPKEVAVRYLDPTRDYYEASQRSVKQQTGSIGRADINATALALTNSQAKIAAIGNHMFAWAERKKYKFTLPLKYAWLDCGDMVQINFSTQSHFVRITKMNYGTGYFDIEGVGQDFTGIAFNVAADGYSGPVATGAFASIPATQTALLVNPTNTQGSSGTPAQQTINYPVISTLMLLDMAIITDGEDGAGYYVGIDKGKFSNYWPGASVYKSSDGASFATLLGLASAMATGQAITALPYGPTELWDLANTVKISLTNGTLASDTEANVLNGANIGILGNEIIQWTTATLDSNGYYTLSGLLRGRRGTEWAVDTHVAGERFILFNTGSVQRTPGVNEEIGLQRIYRAVTVGLNLADQASQNFTNTAKGAKPYSPCQITGTRDGSNNLTISWARRTRTGGAWRDNADVTLGESGEQYDVDIIKAGVTDQAATMTSNTAPAGYIASASSEWTSYLAGNAFHAFDDVPNANDRGWHAIGTSNEWLSYTFPAAMVCSAYSLTSLSRTAYYDQNPKSWVFSGWDGSKWVVLDRRSNEPVWGSAETRKYYFTNLTAYTAYRIFVSENYGGAHIAIQQMQLFSGTIARSITGITTPTTSYTAAQQTADGITPGDPVSVNIYQISSTVGRGYAGAKTI